MKRVVNTTTSAIIDGWTITDYRGVVSSHVVAGTGMGTEFLASFSDLFGGRSGAFQRELASIYDEAMQSLEEKASSRKCNWIVGLKVDINEISGNNLQMLMITAIGTAVSADRTGDEGQKELEDDVAVSGEDVAEIEERNWVIEELTTESEKIEDSTWQFLFENEVPEAAARVLNEAWNYRHIEATKGSVKRYFATLPHETASTILFAALDTDHWRLATELINELDLGNLGHTQRYLDDLDGDKRSRALKTLAAHQRSYSESDRHLITRLKHTIESTFPDKSTRKTVKPLLGKPREQWVCECFRGNDLVREFCLYCKHDRFGFHMSEISMHAAIHILEEREAALSIALGRAGA